MSNISVIALNTFRESIRSKILYTVLLFAALLLLASTFFGTVTIGDQIKVIKDFGLFGISIFTVLYAVISGATLLNKELTKKTIYNILGKAVYRSEFIAGKYLGLLYTSILLALLMSIALMAYLYLFENRFDFLILYAASFFIFELVIICAASIFFSAIVVTPILSGIFTFGVFLAGRSSQYFEYFSDQGLVSGFAAYLFRAMKLLIPNLDTLNVANEVVYMNYNAISPEKFIWSSVYALSYAAFLLTFANLIFKRREFN